jgi:hypothetical protein
MMIAQTPYPFALQIALLLFALSSTFPIAASLGTRQTGVQLKQN